MPPQRIFFSAHDTPSVYVSGHQPVNVGTPGRPEELATYNEDGQLAYIGRNRRPVTPMSVNSIFRISGIADFMQKHPDAAFDSPLRLNTSSSVASGIRHF